MNAGPAYGLRRPSNTHCVYFVRVEEFISPFTTNTHDRLIACELIRIGITNHQVRKKPFSPCNYKSIGAI